MNTKITLSWQDIAYPHTWIGDIDKMRQLSANLGYTMFCWNGRIYNVKTGADTGSTVEDVK